MKNIKKNDLNQEVFDLYDAYAHNKIQRRDFVKKLSTYAVGGLTVSSLMGFLMPDYVNSVQVQPMTRDWNQAILPMNPPKVVEI